MRAAFTSTPRGGHCDPRRLLLLLLLLRHSVAPAAPRAATSRCFHQTTQRRAIPLFHLAALSNSREAQWFTKASGLSPVEHIPTLEAIRSSEVHPYQPYRRAIAVTRPPSSSTSSLPAAQGTARRSAALSIPDARALSIGRQVLHRNAQKVARLERSLRQTKRTYELERAALRAENKRLNTENRSAAAGILAAVGAATVAVTWSTWPGARKPRTSLGEHHAVDAVAGSVVEVPSMPPAVMPAVSVAGAGNSVGAQSAPMDTSALHTPPGPSLPAGRESKGSSWQSWFWRDA
ncbi:hypothetical protein B0A49_09704 [Cryomyces minteri]|uniref:BZIP domain-containing protein n=1 Tax=Cryomyces minteri TaxID=331657 RepID=A0A4U0X556_9PEZI|nr:hypothetical protein B0A49_09704 [Cryomyces minteri]